VRHARCRTQVLVQHPAHPEGNGSETGEVGGRRVRTARGCRR
jgi:hypothetical protein